MNMIKLVRFLIWNVPMTVGCLGGAGICFVGVACCSKSRRSLIFSMASSRKCWRVCLWWIHHYSDSKNLDFSDVWRCRMVLKALIAIFVLHNNSDASFWGLLYYCLGFQDPKRGHFWECLWQCSHSWTKTDVKWDTSELMMLQYLF